ncbi:hypothetical protein F5144DRAFT_635081 [Chaetomium tenue]|uniref:Uncharacterized protein n=1 Tax=Chaetomium tenue TaxID=1854479 RepID=A0ACB7PJV0_9PEZI|nr:hypothetical protein F5144DRAFT_635081 [Chaetomium globosum]
MSAEPKLRVLTVGASIAGPAAAYWLAKAGAKVTVIERFPELRTNGQNVDIRAVGVTVMRKAPGMEAAVRAKAVPMTGISFVDAHDCPFATIQATGNPDQQSLVSEYEILRGDLSQILFDLTNPNPNITYIFGDNGRLPPQPFDLIVAADDAYSRTHALGFNCSLHEHTRSLDAWAAYFTIPQSLIPSDAPTTGRGHSLPGGRYIGIAPTAQPGTTQVTLLRTHARNDNNNNSTSSMHALRTAAQSTTPSLLRQYIANTFTPPTPTPTPTPSPTPSPTPTPRPTPTPPTSTLATPTWHTPTITTFMLPLPPSLALVGGGSGGGGGGDRDVSGGGGGEAFRRYEEVMGPVVRELQSVPGWGLWVRNVVFWFMCWSGSLGVVQRWLGSAVADGKEETLPEYDWVA